GGGVGTPSPLKRVFGYFLHEQKVTRSPGVKSPKSPGYGAKGPTLHHHHPSWLTIRNTPYTALAATPKTITGPATVNILAAMPVISPSLLKSMAGEATALAKPVMGTS